MDMDMDMDMHRVCGMYADSKRSREESLLLVL